MRKSIYIVALLLFATGIIAQTTTQNYVLTRTYQDANANRSLDVIQYFDGLGRPIQTVQKAITPSGKDLANLTEYDAAGREYRHWLPITSTGSGAYVAPATITGNTTSLYGGDSKPYAETILESSPLNRVLGQRQPGAAWNSQPSGVTYGTNTASEVAYYFVNSSNQLQRTGNYAANTLYKTVMADEDGKTSTEYKDKLGRVVMKRNSTNVNTYFVYNDLGQLSYVLPPLAADALASDVTFNDNTTAALTQYAYLYKYDERGNNVVKRLPGCDSILMVYDKADRLVLSQDGNQRLKKQWTVTKYDIFGRVVYTGHLTRDQTRKDLKAILDPLLITESYDGTATFANTGYTCNYFVGEISPLVVNYYDNYKFRRLLSATDSTNLKYATIAGYDAQFGEDKAKGLLTGTRTYILNQKTTSFLEKVSYQTNALYYDAYGRVVQTRGINHFGSYEYAYNHYDFTGKLLMNKKYHGGLSINEVTRNEYDNAGRLIKVRYKIDYKDTVTLAQYNYDELGRPIQKLRHNGTDTEQFAYNIRNWPTWIKSGVFEENLYYENNPTSQTAPNFNGNISCQTWTYNGATNYYNYDYDDLNRLTWAYNEDLDNGLDKTEAYEYDKMGNITHLERHRSSSEGMDMMSFAHYGNQLKKITDLDGNQAIYGLKEYVDAVDVEIEFKYDKNGNMTTDLDRGIVAIRYNILNLPDTVQFANGNQIVNRYTASGQKIRTEYFTRVTALAAPLTEGATIQQSYTYGVVNQNGSAYVDNVEYKTTNGSSLGRCRVYNSEGFANVYGHLSYYRKDHLGNNREVWQAGYTGVTAGTVQRTQYYPSGLPWAEGTGASVQSRKYNGKEFVEMHGYDTYDYGARGYYVAMNSWTSVDPLAEKHPEISPYVYCAGNPVRYVDPDGRDFIVLSMNKGNQELRRIKMDGEDRYYKVNEDAFNKASKSFTNDNQDYNTMLSIGSLRTQERNSDQTGLIAEQTGVGVSVSGSMRDGNNLIGDVQVTFQANFDDNSNYAISSYNAVAGGYGNGAPENGDYTVNNYQDRSPSGWYSSGMNRDGVGFSYNLNPQFNTGRSDLRVHPDGNNEGTLGCIGLTGNAQGLTDFRNTLNGYLQNRSSLPVNINITNNPNNNGRNGTRIPHVRE